MKKAFLQIFACIAISNSVFAQIIHDNYQDGKIWFKLKNNQIINTPVNFFDPANINKSDIDIVNRIDKVTTVKRLSQPFHAVKNYPALNNVYLLQLTDPAKVDLVIEMLIISGSVEYAEKVPLDKPMAAPNDPYYGSQWGLSKINAEAAWVFSAGSANVKVAIVDDAFQANNPSPHSDLNFWTNTSETPPNGIDDDNNGYKDDTRGFDVANNTWLTNPPNSQYFHGTRVAGVVGALTNNNMGVASIGNGIKIVPVKATDSPGSISNGYEGIVYGAVIGANVICISWASPVSSITGQNVINYAHAQGCVLVAAAGNDNTNNMYYPAAYNHVIAVAATQSNDVKAPFSNYGNWIDVSAPGTNIYTTDVAGAYVVASGTSYAAGMVAGLAGLMLSYNPGLSAADVESCIKSSAASIATQNPSFNGLLGTGRIDAFASMGCVGGTIYNTPVADFYANVTTVKSGGKVIFTNTSYHSPTSYTWSFQGGVPSTTITASKNPVEVVYNTTGLKTVTLTANRTTPVGSDVETKVGYINVVNGEMCDTLNIDKISGTTPAWTATQYYRGSAGMVGEHGWANGVNQDPVQIDYQKEKAQWFDLNFSPADKLVKVWIYFGQANVTGGGGAAGKYIRVKIYDQSSSTLNPLNLIASSDTIHFQRIIDDVAAGRATEVDFPCVPIPVSGAGIVGNTFFVSIAMMGDAATGGNLDWATDHDTLSIVSNTHPQTTIPSVYQKNTDGSWCRIDGPCSSSPSWSANKTSLYIFPHMTSECVDAVFTKSDDTICEGNYIIYDATGSTHQDTLYWTFAGGNPSHSNKLRDTVYYVNKPNSAVLEYNTTLIVRGGGCIAADTMVQSVVIHSSPKITVTNSSTAVCAGGASTVTSTASSSLASSFDWFPATGLSATTGSSVTISPTSTQTYDVHAISSEGCEANTSFTIRVDSVPVAISSPVPDTSCAGDPVQFSASLSQAGTSYSWSFSGANPSTSSAVGLVATYTANGTYTYTLEVSNSCGSSTIVDTLMITCLRSVNELFSSKTVKAYFLEQSNSIELTINTDNTLNSLIHVRLIDQLGQYVEAKALPLNRGINVVGFDASRLARGVYTVLVTDNKINSFAQKIVIH